ncbi:Bug family tripartite tricarboxylate transporter substrate binding protein [Neoroseomonas oryzicola]|uniref:Tripartite tricarboxylate transporter substrate binding protein n=1 Tax=Neoroseomonas oryzicola TaxID=535904 RepID=A0A9X9WHV9_9PROT|nr:tripartite tricarboxylate transporter substrate binding protein [Neoroseomonas oryzicola]MBR0659919.1 tripartite tricarboxylate transporter substrate binding protein [Neoroseomonas oryzicola]NKE16462.1 tripartite tricarboxylate transporter substrate binding protein [Neoroseomonas oryzicola]
MAAIRRRALMLAAPGLALPFAARGQGAWPDRPIRWINPGPAGGAGDVMSRLAGDRLSAKLGQPVVVENRPGAGTNIGMTAVARSAPDGYTLGLASIASHAANKWLYPNMPFDPEKDFAAVGMIALVPNIVVVPPSIPPKTLQEFVAWAKGLGRPLNFGSVGIGSSQHLAAAQFGQITGIEIIHAPYNQAGQMNTDLIEARLDVLFQSISAVASMAQAGRMRPIAVSGPDRVPAFPDLPTMREQGVDVTTTGWFGLATPAGVPEPILARLDETLAASLAEEELRQRIIAGGSVPTIMRRADFARFMAEQSEKMGAIIRASGARLQ